MEGGAHVHSSNHTPFLMHMRIDAMKVAAAVLTASNCRETKYFCSTLVSMETVETPLDLPLGISDDS